jgi:hypothetical protein
MSFDRLAAAGAQIVGIVILVTGAIKAAAPGNFRDHLSGLRIIPESWLNPAVAGAAGVEGAWGYALLIGLWPALLPAFSAVLMVALSAITLWSVRAGRAEDCGCYGGFVRPSIGQSMALNCLYVALLLGTAFARRKTTPTALWEPSSALALGIVFAGVAELVRRTSPIPVAEPREPSPLQAGREWTAAWAAGSLAEDVGEHIVSYLGPRCPYCRSWVRILNIAHESPTFPEVTGVVAEAGNEIDEFIRTAGIKFPVVTITPSLMNTLAKGVPTTVSIKSGVINEVWTGNVSPTFFEQFKRSFFPAAELAGHDT